MALIVTLCDHIKFCILVDLRSYRHMETSKLIFYFHASKIQHHHINAVNFVKVNVLYTELNIRTTSYNWRCCVFSVAYCRTVSARRGDTCRGRFAQADHLSAESGLGRSTSATNESMSPGQCGRGPVNQRSVPDLCRRKASRRRPVSYSQENIWRQSQPSHLQRARKYVCMWHFVN